MSFTYRHFEIKGYAFCHLWEILEIIWVFVTEGTKGELRCSFKHTPEPEPLPCATRYVLQRVILTVLGNSCKCQVTPSVSAHFSHMLTCPFFDKNRKRRRSEGQAEENVQSQVSQGFKILPSTELEGSDLYNLIKVNRCLAHCF